VSAPVVEPQACRWCEIAERGHGRQFADAVGWHEWAAPSDAQVLARMKARRLAQTVSRVGALPVPAGDVPEADGITRLTAPTQALRVSWEDPHDSPLHHDYRPGLGRDLPETGGA